MNQEFFDWLLLLLRWLHIVAGVCWIGNSIFFMWLDRTFLKNPKTDDSSIGEVWMVHGGGFYHVEKLQMGKIKVPEHLHWFKWESYWTWMSGICLLALIFYTSSGSFLLDSTVSDITFSRGLFIGISSIVLSWVFYDTLWESSLTKKTPLAGHALTLAWFAGMTYFLCHTFSGRAAYIHIGSMLGTWMAGNVFFRIIPRQAKMVEATKEGKEVNPDWSKNAKARSTHNTYFGLPVIFIMLSNHFPSIYGNQLNWLILIFISMAGASIREYFITRIQKPQRSKIFGAVGVSIILGLVFFTRENSTANIVQQGPEVVPVVQASKGEISIKGIVKYTGKIVEAKPVALPPRM